MLLNFAAISIKYLVSKNQSFLGVEHHNDKVVKVMPT